MATPSLAMIPSGYKASKVYSVLPESGVGDFDFTRATTATRVNSSGLIEEMAINVPRLEYPLIDGVVNGCPSLLLEPQRTNLITDSQTFTGTLSEVNRQSNSADIVDPFGTNTAFKFTVLTSGADANTRITNSISITEFSISIYVNGLAGQKFELFLARDSYSQIFSTKEVLSGGWQRIELNGTFSTSSTTVVIGLEFGFTSDDSVAGQEYYLTGLQLEQGSYPTSYIPTNGSSVTRNAETCNGAGNADTFNDSEGVFMAEISALADDESGRYLSISNVGNYQIRIGFFSGELYVQIRINGSVVYSHSETVILTNNNKISIKYTNNTQKVYINGYLVNSETISTIFPLGTLTSLRFNNGDLLGGEFYGNTKQIQYYNSALTDSELEQLTSWTSFTDMANGQQYSII